MAMSEHPRIVISGFTAAGKTTHGLLLAKALGIPYYSAAELFGGAVNAGTDEDHSRRWKPQVDEIRRNSPGIDDYVDSRMAQLLTEGTGVFDASLLPWTETSSPAVRVWLDSGLLARSRKCYISHLSDERLSLEQACQRVVMKDRVSVARLLQKSGKAMWPDPDLFDVIISNDDAMQKVLTQEAADTGIHEFYPVFETAVRQALEEKNSNPRSEWVVYTNEKPVDQFSRGSK